MTYPGEVLVAIMNKPLDFAIAQEQGWYRIPTASVEKWMKDKWPPKWLAFYQTKVFGEDAYAVNYFAEVIGIQKVRRMELFPDEPEDNKSKKLYFKISFNELQRLERSIPSRLWRRIVFIPTDWKRFTNAREINDLYSGSTLEERMWDKLKHHRIPAERQELVTIKDIHYFLDFAIYCSSGNIDVETDGDKWHHTPEGAIKNNVRDNNLKTSGWKIFHFTGKQIMEQMGDYCIPTILENINRMGGLDEGGIIPRKIDPKLPPGSYQPSIFDDLD